MGDKFNKVYRLFIAASTSPFENLLYNNNNNNYNKNQNCHNKATLPLTHAEISFFRIPFSIVPLVPEINIPMISLANLDDLLKNHWLKNG